MLAVTGAKPLWSSCVEEMVDRHLLSLPGACQSQRVSMMLVQDCVAQHAGYLTEQLLSQRRTKDLAFWRHVAMYLAWELSDASLPQIAAAFRRRDHTTVIYARDRILARVKADTIFRERIDELRELILSIHHGVVARISRVERRCACGNRIPSGRLVSCSARCYVQWRSTLSPRHRAPSPKAMDRAFECRTPIPAA
ncbi:hypothetical protein EPN44_01400 [bacterium]|nr:MAG: hypothetical protein EPN44_01400 [bacterium]